MYAMTPAESGILELGKELGKGGEGTVYEVTAHRLTGLPPATQLVAKVYHEPLAENRPKKLKAMISNPVHDPAVAWPLAVIVDEHKQFLGYLMKRLESSAYREWLYVANSKDRRKVAPAFDVRYAYAAVRNLAAALLTVHSTGHRIGDLNESNIFLGADATVLIVDTDSMQVQASDGTIFPCAVGKPEFTAPELTHGSLRDTPRTSETDIFAFTVAAYQLLTGGATPHQGAFDPNSDDDPLPTVERIRKGVLPSLRPADAARYGFTPRPGVPANALPEPVRNLFISFLSVDPAERSSGRLSRLVEYLDSFISNLQQCSKEKLHWHPRGEACYWCAEASRGVGDPWADTHIAPPSQARLAPISFQDEQNHNGNNRAPAAVAGAAAHLANQQPATTPHSSLAQQAHSAAASYSPQTAATPVAPPAPARPKKIKGKVTVEYADGSWSVRPPLAVLLRQRPSLAIWALKEETPEALRFWWPVERKLANIPGLLVGLFSALLISGLWFFGAKLGLEAIPALHFSPALVDIIALIPVATSIFAGIFLFFAALLDRARTKKKYGNLSGFKEESLGKTASRFIPIGLFYGLPIVVVIAITSLYGLISFVRAVAKA